MHNLTEKEGTDQAFKFGMNPTGKKRFFAF